MCKVSNFLSQFRIKSNPIEDRIRKFPDRTQFDMLLLASFRQCLYISQFHLNTPLSAVEAKFSRRKWWRNQLGFHIQRHILLLPPLPPPLSRWASELITCQFGEGGGGGGRGGRGRGGGSKVSCFIEKPVCELGGGKGGKEGVSVSQLSSPGDRGGGGGGGETPPRDRERQGPKTQGLAENEVTLTTSNIH